MNAKKVAYFFCMDKDKDMVAPFVYEELRALKEMTDTAVVVDGYPVQSNTDMNGNVMYFIRTQTVICMEYDRYIPIINDHFSDCDLAVLINWHGGANAPDRVICIHTVGDVASVNFGPSEPLLSSSLARKLELYRAKEGLADFRVTTEATHWSGVVYGGDVAWIKASDVPFLDLEIGSTEQSYCDKGALRVIAMALAGIFDDVAQIPAVLYCGGMHFEDTITSAVLHETHPVALTHILPSRWLESEVYSGENGVLALRQCLGSIKGGIKAFVVHEKLKREQRELIETLAEEMGIPLIKRKALKSPQESLIYNK